jgi:hypothetical protein
MSDKISSPASSPAAPLVVTRATPVPGRAKRRHPRAGLPATAALFTDKRPLGPCLVEDLSVGGMRLITGTAVRRGRVVSVLLDLPGRGPVMAFAQVARHEQRGASEHMLALSFLNLDRRDAERLESLVAHLLAESHPCLEFFDTDEDGRPRRLVLADDAPAVD